jgi:hypothetical protein
MQRRKMRDQSAFGTKNGEAKKKKKNKNLKKIKNPDSLPHSQKILKPILLLPSC